MSEDVQPGAASGAPGLLGRLAASTRAALALILLGVLFLAAKSQMDSAGSSSSSPHSNNNNNHRAEPLATLQGLRMQQQQGLGGSTRSRKSGAFGSSTSFHGPGTARAAASAGRQPLQQQRSAGPAADGEERLGLAAQHWREMGRAGGVRSSDPAQQAKAQLHGSILRDLATAAHHPRRRHRAVARHRGQAAAARTSTSTSTSSTSRESIGGSRTATWPPPLPELSQLPVAQCMVQPFSGSHRRLTSSPDLLSRFRACLRVQGFFLMRQAVPAETMDQVVAAAKATAASPPPPGAPADSKEALHVEARFQPLLKSTSSAMVGMDLASALLYAWDDPELMLADGQAPPHGSDPAAALHSLGRVFIFSVLRWNYVSPVVHRDKQPKRQGYNQSQAYTMPLTDLDLTPVDEAQRDALHRFAVARVLMYMQPSSLQFLAHSHTTPCSEERVWKCFANVSEAEWTTLELGPGDVMVWDARIIHRGIVDATEQADRGRPKVTTSQRTLFTADLGLPGNVYAEQHRLHLLSFLTTAEHVMADAIRSDFLQT